MTNKKIWYLETYFDCFVRLYFYFYHNAMDIYPIKMNEKNWKVFGVVLDINSATEITSL